MRTIVRFLPLSLILLTASCTKINVKYDYSDDYDFSKLETFDMKIHTVAPEGESPHGFAFFKTKIEDAIKSDLEMKGFQNESDCETDFQVVIKTIVGKTMGIGPRELWGKWIYLKPADAVHEYEIGWVVVDIVDNQTKKGVWRGIAKPLRSKFDLSEEEIAETVKNILTNFPPDENSRLGKGLH